MRELWISMQLPMCSKAPQSPASKLNIKTGRPKDPFPSLPSSGPQEERTWLWEVLSSSCPGWHCSGQGSILTGGSHRQHESPGTRTGNTPVRPTLFGPDLLCFWGNDVMSEKLYYCMILGLREKPREQESSAPGLCLGLCCKSWTQTCSSPVRSRVN